MFQPLAMGGMHGLELFISVFTGLSTRVTSMQFGLRMFVKFIAQLSVNDPA